MRYSFVFFVFFLILHLCYILPDVFQVLTSKHLCIVSIGEPCAEGPLCKTRSSVCGSGCAGRKNGDRRTGRWVRAYYCECAAGPNAPMHRPSRSLLLRRSAIPSRVHLKANQTVASILRPPACRCRKTSELPLQRLPAVSSVSATTEGQTSGRCP